MAFRRGYIGFTIPVCTALLPYNFTAPPDIISELRPDFSNPIIEYSEKELSLNLKSIPCIPVDRIGNPWILANPIPNWSIIFHSNNIISGTDYWINYKPDGLLEYLRARADNYDLIYKRDGINIFTLQVSQFYELGTWKVRITLVWHILIRTITESELILQDMLSIFNNHNECSVCLDDAFLIKWPACSHAFCQDCTSAWRRNNDTCPLCRALAI